MQDKVVYSEVEDGGSAKGQKEGGAETLPDQGWYLVEKTTAERFFSAARDLVEEVIMWQYSTPEGEAFIRELEKFKRSLKPSQRCD